MSFVLNNRHDVFSALSKRSSDAHLLADHNAHILYVNEKACTMLGYSENELMSMGLQDIDVLFDVKAFNDLCEEAKKKHIHPVETMFRRKSGDTFYGESSVTGYEDDQSKLLFIALRDITERKLAEEGVMDIARGVSAAVGEKFFHSLAKHLSEILQADYAYIAEIVRDDPAAVRTLSLISGGNILQNIEVNLPGTPCETSITQNLKTYVEGVCTMFPKADMMKKMGVEGYSGKLLYSSSKKKLGLMAVMYRSPIKNRSHVESVLRIFAERASNELERIQNEESLRKANAEIDALHKALEQRVREKTQELMLTQAQLIQSEKLSALGRMASGLAHELNSPLAGLLPLIEKFRERYKEDSEDYVEMTYMYRACLKMAKIVKDLVYFSRASKNDLMPLKLSEVIEDTMSFSAVKLRQKGITIHTSYDDDLPYILGEKTELQQVVLNLLSNAAGVMDEGGSFTMKTGTDNDKGTVFMEFSDTGPGIERDDLDKIFDPFFTTGSPGMGAGLGLSVTYGIITKYGGEISVESVHGEGTRFLITFPALKLA